jgi:hypothetical protein
LHHLFVVQFIIGKENMTELNEEPFEVIEKNKIERYERQKITFLEDELKMVKKSVEQLNLKYGDLQNKIDALMLNKNEK